MSYDIGFKTEQFVLKRLKDAQIGCVYKDDWYDIELSNGELLEVKSCNLSVKHILKGRRKPDCYRVGRFDFTKEETRDKLWKANAWICFVIRFRDQYLVCGFIRAKEIPKKRYFTVHDLRRYPLSNIDEFKEEMKNNES